MGPQGPPGPQGVPGFNGTDGATGATGAPGEKTFFFSPLLVVLLLRCCTFLLRDSLTPFSSQNGNKTGPAGGPPGPPGSVGPPGVQGEAACFLFLLVVFCPSFVTPAAPPPISRSLIFLFPILTLSRLFPCTSSKPGPSGTTGPAGAPGAVGAAGATGPQGLQGKKTLLLYLFDARFLFALTK